MLLEASFAIIVGLIILVWSADRFVDAAAALARYLGMSPLLIGILIIGFGTSMPEMVVSALSAFNSSPGIALGNAYGSNITNIALILGLTALIKPLVVHGSVIKKELPILLSVTFLSAYFLLDMKISSLEAYSLLVIFIAYVFWTIWSSKKQRPSVQATYEEDTKQQISFKASAFWLIAGLILLMLSSQLLVWGAIKVANYLGVSDLVIGLTVVAIGTSLPEVAASIVAARKGEVDLAVGNIIGSNLYNTLAVVGLAGAIMPIEAESKVLSRDMLMMSALTMTLFIFGLIAYKKQHTLGRFNGLFFFASYVGYTIFLVRTAL
ncbi:MAG: calcium/sodium antiporter [Pasteurella oralis]|uniref:calcium/sodium antiporter n=1 Tax=Pasteurella oralis TaxID=1071947 RepID=UPI00270BCCF6|nr:calcium/sodium antiporter [Pasteurella oralis]